MADTQGYPSLISRLAEWRLSRLEESGWRPGRGRPLGWQVSIARRLISRDTIQGIQLIRLRRTIGYTAARSPFYRDLLRRAGIDPLAIRVPDGLSALPFTSAEDLVEPERFLCVPPDQIGHIFTTSGTTVEPKRIYFTFRDLERIVNLGAASLSFSPRPGLRLPPHAVALIAFPQGLWIGSHQSQRVVERAGGLPLPIGMPPPDQALRSIALFHPNTLMTSPSYLGALTRAAERQGRHHNIPYIVLGGEDLSLEQTACFAEWWGADVFNSYGMTEIGGGQAVALPGCRALHLDEVQVLAEIVDPETGRPAERGELVFTTLARDAMPLLRYRSGDLASWVECDCGSPLRSFVIEGRLGDMFVAGDLNLYGHRIAEAVGHVPGTTGRVEILLDRVALVDHLTLRVEKLPGQSVSADAVREALLRTYPEMRTNLTAGALDLSIEVVDDLGALAKAYRIVDARRV